MKYPERCDLCNSPKIVACDEIEQELFFYCSRCGEMFDVAKRLKMVAGRCNATTQPKYSDQKLAR